MPTPRLGRSSLDREMQLDFTVDRPLADAA
jgi:hypothetical protein